MTTKQNKLYEHLCVKDPRYPDYAALFPADEYEPGEVVPRVGCSCDNCFRGKDRLAVTAIELLEVLEDAAEVVGSWGEGGDPELVIRAQAAVKKARGE